MPFRNGIQFDLGNVYLCNPDGDVVGEFSNMKLADIQEFDDTCCTEDSGDKVWGKIDYNREYSFICHYNGAWRAMKKIMYGWTAKGPIRCRVLEKLWKIKRKKCEVDISVSPDYMEIKIEPWKPYEMKCPYGKDDKDV